MQAGAIIEWPHFKDSRTRSRSSEPYSLSGSSVPSKRPHSPPAARLDPTRASILAAPRYGATMADDLDMHDVRSDSGGAHSPHRSDSSVSTTTDENNEPTIHQPVPKRPRLPSRKSSGPLVVPRDSSAVGPVESHFGPDDVRAMSPRRTSEDIDKLGKEAREEMRRHAKALQESLITIFNRIEAVREEHDKLDNNNKFLQKYIGDLMNTGKITASGSRLKK